MTLLLTICMVLGVALVAAGAIGFFASRRRRPGPAAPSERDDIDGLFENWPVRSKGASP